MWHNIISSSNKATRTASQKELFLFFLCQFSNTQNSYIHFSLSWSQPICAYGDGIPHWCKKVLLIHRIAPICQWGNACSYICNNADARILAFLLCTLRSKGTRPVRLCEGIQIGSLIPAAPGKISIIAESVHAAKRENKIHRWCCNCNNCHPRQPERLKSIPIGFQPDGFPGFQCRNIKYFHKHCPFIPCNLAMIYHPLLKERSFEYRL